MIYKWVVILYDAFRTR